MTTTPSGLRWGLNKIFVKRNTEHSTGNGFIWENMDRLDYWRTLQSLPPRWWKTQERALFVWCGLCSYKISFQEVNEDVLKITVPSKGVPRVGQQSQFCWATYDGYQENDSPPHPILISGSNSLYPVCSKNSLNRQQLHLEPPLASSRLMKRVWGREGKSPRSQGESMARLG